LPCSQPANWQPLPFSWPCSSPSTSPTRSTWTGPSHRICEWLWLRVDRPPGTTTARSPPAARFFFAELFRGYWFRHQHNFHQLLPKIGGTNVLEVDEHDNARTTLRYDLEKSAGSLLAATMLDIELAEVLARSPAQRVSVFLAIRGL